MDASVNPASLGALAVELAEGAAALVRDGRARGRAVLDVDAKSTDTDLVTDVDRASEQWLAAEIARRRPGDGIRGEEGADRRSRTGVEWIVDPVDGTVNFVLGIPHYAVSVAAAVDGTVVAGAVCNAATGELFRATAGGGAWRHDGGTPNGTPSGTEGGTDGSDGERLTGPREVPLARAVVGTGFGYAAALRAGQVAVVAPLLPRIADIRRLGSAALDLCYVACGRLDAYFEADLHSWDHAAGGLVAREAGCVVTGLRGRAASRRLLLAAPPALAGPLGALLEELGADDLGVPDEG